MTLCVFGSDAVTIVRIGSPRSRKGSYEKLTIGYVRKEARAGAPAPTRWNKEFHSRRRARWCSRLNNAPFRQANPKGLENRMPLIYNSYGISPQESIEVDFECGVDSILFESLGKLVPDRVRLES